MAQWLAKELCKTENFSSSAAVVSFVFVKVSVNVSIETLPFICFCESNTPAHKNCGRMGSESANSERTKMGADESNCFRRLNVSRDQAS